MDPAAPAAVPAAQPSALRTKSKAYQTTIAAEADDLKYESKYKELKKKVKDVEEDNDQLYAKILVTQQNIRRLRLERAIIYERLACVVPAHLLAQSTTGAVPATPAPPSREHDQHGAQPHSNHPAPTAARSSNAPGQLEHQQHPPASTPAPSHQSNNQSSVHNSPTHRRQSEWREPPHQPSSQHPSSHSYAHPQQQHPHSQQQSSHPPAPSRSHSYTHEREYRDYSQGPPPSSNPRPTIDSNVYPQHSRHSPTNVVSPSMQHYPSNGQHPAQSGGRRPSIVSGGQGQSQRPSDRGMQYVPSSGLVPMGHSSTPQSPKQPTLKWEEPVRPPNDSPTVEFKAGNNVRFASDKGFVVRKDSVANLYSRGPEKDWPVTSSAGPTGANTPAPVPELGYTPQISAPHTPGSAGSGQNNGTQAPPPTTTSGAGLTFVNTTVPGKRRRDNLGGEDEGRPRGGTRMVFDS